MDAENEKNSNTASALKAGTWYVVSSIFVKAISILTTPIFTRIMTKEQYGITASFTSWYALLLPLCSLNLAYSVGRAKLDFPGKLDRYIGSMMLLSAMVTAGIAAVCILCLKPLSAWFNLDPTLIVLLMVYLFFSPAINFVQNGYRYRYQYKQNIAIALYIGIGTVALSLLLMLTVHADRALLRILGIVIPNCLLSLVFWFRALRRGDVRFDAVYWKYALSLSLPMVLHAVSLNILSQSDRIFIQLIQGESATAIYSLAYTYGLGLSVVTNAIGEGWLPWFHDNYFNRKFDAIRSNTKTIVTLGCFVGLACISLAPEAIKILGGEGYKEAVTCVPPIVLGVVCQFIYTHYVNIELHLKKTKYVSLGTILAAITNVVLNAIFIPRYGFVAAAYTTLTSYFILMLVHYAITHWVLKVKLYHDAFMFAAMAGTFALAMILVLTYETQMIRYGLILIGFVFFVLLYWRYIAVFVRKKLSRRRK